MHNKDSLEWIVEKQVKWEIVEDKEEQKRALCLKLENTT